MLMSWTLLSSLVSSVVGFAYSPIAGSMIFHVLDSHVEALSILLVSSISLQSYAVFSLRRDFNWIRFLPFLVGRLAGLVPGLAILSSFNPGMLIAFVGSITLGYGIFVATGLTPNVTSTRKRYDIVAGFLGGITGPVAAFPGAFVTIWCAAKGGDKQQQRAVFQPYILTMQVLSLTAIMLIFPLKQQVSLKHLAFVVPAVIGAALGMAIFRRLTNGQFQRLLGLFLVFAGLSLLLKVIGAS